MDEIKIYFYQNNGRRKVWRRKGPADELKHTFLSVTHGGDCVMTWACMVRGTSSLMVTDDRECGWTNQIEFRGAQCYLSARVQTNAAKLLGWRFTLQMDNDPKHYCESNPRFLGAKIKG